MPAKKRTRVRLSERKKRDMTACDAARDKSYAEAPRSKRGRIIPGYSYKNLISGYEEMGRKPTVWVGKRTNVQAPMFVSQPSLARRIIKLLKRGYPYTTVCRYCGITPMTFKGWLEKGKAGVAVEYTEFWKQVAKAESYAEMRALKKLQSHENADWRVSAWQLERRWPEHWSKKDRMVAEMHVNANINVDSKESLGQEVLKDDAARELARRLIDSESYSGDLLEHDGGE